MAENKLLADGKWYWLGDQFETIYCPECGTPVTNTSRAVMRVKFDDRTGENIEALLFTCGQCQNEWPVFRDVFISKSWDRPGVKTGD